MFYYFYGYAYPNEKRLFVGTNRVKLILRKKDFLSTHYKNQATMVYSSADIKIFDLKVKK